MRSEVTRRGKAGKATGSSPSSSRQLDQISPLQYSNDEEALEAGTELEEKAERFAIGWKAQKYFERSLSFYNRALALNSTSSDALYNSARVLFLLATDFYIPPKSIEALQESCNLYRRSLHLISPVEGGESSDGSPSAFYLDVQFNLAVTLLALADQMEHGKNDTARRLTIINEAIRYFSNVINGQETVLHRQKLEEEEQSVIASRGEELQDGINSQLENVDGMDGDKMDADEEEEGEGQVRSEYTTSLITPSSALETIHNLHLSSLALLDVADDDVAVINNAVQLSHSSLQRGVAIFNAFPDGEARSPDNEWVESLANLHYAQLEIDVMEMARRSASGTSEWSSIHEVVSSTSQKVLQEANSLLSSNSTNVPDLSTTKGRSSHRIYLQHLEQLGDLLLVSARTQLLFLLSQGSGVDSSLLSQSCWAALTLASKVFLAVTKSLDTSAGSNSSAAVLGSSNASNATTRRRCSLYTNMSTLSILRTNLTGLEGSSIPNVDTKTREQLANNGRVYARKAVTEVGLGWLLTQGGAPKARYELPHGGLESVQGEQEAILTLLRSLYVRSTILQGTTDMQEVEIICSNVYQGLLLRGEHSSTWRWLFFPNNNDETSQVTHLIEQILGEEGISAVSEREYAFWSQVRAAWTQ